MNVLLVSGQHLFKSTYFLSGYHWLGFSTCSSSPSQQKIFSPPLSPPTETPTLPSIELQGKGGIKYSVRASKAIDEHDAEVNLLFYSKQQISPTQGEEEIELFNKNDNRFPTLFFSNTELTFNEDGLASFQIGVKNKVGLQVGAAQPKGWNTQNKRAGHGVGDNDRSFGYDPIHGLAWHNMQCFPYGEPCDVGDIIRCVVRKGDTTSTIEFQRIVNGKVPHTFGTAFEFNNNKLEGMKPAISFARFQRILFPHRSQCTTDLFQNLQQVNKSDVTNVESVHAFYDYIDEQKNYFDLPETNILHWACVFGHLDFVEHVLQKIRDNEKSVVDYLVQTNDCGYTPIHMCIQGRQPKILKLLLSELGKIADGMDRLLGLDSTPLFHVAARIGSIKCLKVLVDDVDISETVNSLNHEKQTPLFIALRGGHVMCAELIIRCGGIVKYEEEVSTSDVDPLSYITMRPESVLLLLSHKRKFKDLLNKLQPEGFLKTLLSQKMSFDEIEPTISEMLPEEANLHNTKKLITLRYKTSIRNVYFTTEIKYFTVAEIVYICTRAMQLVTPAQLFCFALSDGTMIPLTQICEYIKNTTEVNPSFEILRRKLEQEAERELVTEKKFRVEYFPLVTL